MKNLNFLFCLVILCTAVWTVHGGCSKTSLPFTAVYQRSDDEWEKCFVYVDVCLGDCYSDYEHRPHLVGDYTNAHHNCAYSFRHCEITGGTSTVMKTLQGCKPINTALTTEFDPQNPWQVETVNAVNCHCHAAVTGNYANNRCPPPSVYY